MVLISHGEGASRLQPTHRAISQDGDASMPTAVSSFPKLGPQHIRSQITAHSSTRSIGYTSLLQCAMPSMVRRPPRICTPVWFTVVSANPWDIVVFLQGIASWASIRDSMMASQGRCHVPRAVSTDCLQTNSTALQACVRDLAIVTMPEEKNISQVDPLVWAPRPPIPDKLSLMIWLHARMVPLGCMEHDDGKLSADLSAQKSEIGASFEVERSYCSISTFTVIQTSTGSFACPISLSPAQSPHKSLDMTQEGLLHVPAAKATAFALSILQYYGVPEERALLIADSLVLADLRGVDTHGINRLAGYVLRIKHGVLTPNPPLEFVMKTPVVAHLDAKDTFGFVAGCASIDKGIEIAEKYGFGVVGVKNSHHYGMAATYVLRAIASGYAALAFTNASRSMPAWGSKEPLLGTSPFTVGVPGGTKGDFVLDMTPSVAARGKIRKAARRGESIPEGYALDADGNPTTDPEAALKGVVLPMGGPKGSGLAMMMDIFGGLLTGAAFAGGVNDQFKNLKNPQNVGHWFMVFKPAVFLDSDQELETRMDTLCDTVRSSEKAAGVDRIYTPGERSALMEAQRRAEGIPFTRSEVDALHELGKSLAIANDPWQIGQRPGGFIEAITVFCTLLMTSLISAEEPGFKRCHERSSQDNIADKQVQAAVSSVTVRKEDNMKTTKMLSRV
nr:l-sulfolactate dehydrogenase [Quercus suber]